MQSRHKLFVSNIHFHATEEELSQVFRSAGIDIRSLKIATDRETGKSRGFAFVEVSQASDLSIAIERLDGRDLRGRNLNVQRSREKAAVR